MTDRILFLLCFLLIVISTCSSSEASVLATAANFSVLGGSSVVNTGPTVLNGDLGLYPGTSITGTNTITLIPPSAIHNKDSVSLQAQIDLTAAVDALEHLPFTIDLTGQNLGGLTLFPGVYRFGTSAQINGLLTLDAQTKPGALFVFQIQSTLNETANSNVSVINGTADTGIFWRVGTSATLDTNAMFAGNILAGQSITLNTNSAIECGRALAQGGSVTLNTNVVSNSCSFNDGTGRSDFGSFGFSGQSVPEPGTVVMLSAGSLALVGKWLFDRHHRCSSC